MEPHDQVLVALRRIIRAIDLRSKRLMLQTGLTAPQLLLLRAAQRRTVAAVGTIAADLTLSQATVTSIVKRLESRGLITRERDGLDRRRVLIRVTAAGSLALANAPTLLQEHFVQAFSQLKDWEQSTIVAAVQRVAEMMDAADIDAAPLLETGPLAG